MKLLKVNEAFNYSPTTNQGIFYFLQNLTGVDVPWKELLISDKLDYFYHLQHSGNKIVSPLIDSFITDDVISTEQKQEIASIIYTLFNQTWARLWEVYNSEYNPISNYDMTEEYSESEDGNFSEDNTQTNNLSATRTDNLTNTRTDNLTQTETPGETITTDKGIFGFNNPSTPSPSDHMSEVHTGSNGITNTGTQTQQNTGTQTQTNTGTVQDAKEGEHERALTHTLTRFGNVGVTTTQEMIQAEIALWQWNYFINVIIPNIDGVLTISLY